VAASAHCHIPNGSLTAGMTVSWACAVCNNITSMDSFVFALVHCPERTCEAHSVTILKQEGKCVNGLAQLKSTRGSTVLGKEWSLLGCKAVRLM
jgi:hypothetical protein